MIIRERMFQEGTVRTQFLRAPAHRKPVSVTEGFCLWQREDAAIIYRDRDDLKGVVFRSSLSPSCRVNTENIST